MLTEREKFWQMLTICCSPRSFKFDHIKKTIHIDLPILPENIKKFKKEILHILGNPEIPNEDWDSDPIHHNYKIDSRYINIDKHTIVINKKGQLVINEDLVPSIIQEITSSLNLNSGKNEIDFDNFQGFSNSSIKGIPQIEPYIEDHLYSELSYANLNNWYLFPEKITGKLDVFLLYPTTVFDKNKELLISPDDPEMLKGVTQFLKTIKPIFKNLPVNLYMPKIHQFNGIKIKSLSQEFFKEKGQIILEEAKNAFNFVLSRGNFTNQLITFSHEQGSAINYYLSTIIKNPNWKNIWSIGCGFDNSIQTKFTISGEPDDFNTIITWNSVLPNELTINSPNWGNGTSLSINPLTFSKTLENITENEHTSLLKIYNNIYQVEHSIKAQVVKNNIGNEILKIEGLENLHIDCCKFSKLCENEIGIFAKNIRENLIKRYNLED